MLYWYHSYLRKADIKLFGKVLQMRLQELAEELSSDSQCFHCGRVCIDLIFSAWQLLGKNH